MVSTSTGSRLFNGMINLRPAVKRRLSALLMSPAAGAGWQWPPVLVTHPLELDGDDEGGTSALVVDVDPLLIRSSASAAPALFPAFFLVAVEAGSFARGFILLALYPVLRLLASREVLLRAMAMVAFCGLRRDEAARIGRAVMPKYFFQESDMEVLEKVGRTTKKVKVAAVTRTFPTVMVEAFLKDYMGFDVVVGREIAELGGGYLAGVMDGVGDGKTAGVEEDEKLSALVKKTEKRPGHSYPKPLIFHDGRLTFTPTPTSALAMYVYLPLGVALAVVRIGIYILLPRHMTRAAARFSGVGLRVIGAPPPPLVEEDDGSGGGGGRLFACNHRTLLDPIAISVALGQPVTAATYSLSRVSELLSPIPLLQLTREREEDRRRMATALWRRREDVVVCPEGTTCREPYVLKLSPLFTELTRMVVPVAVETCGISMFHGTSTSPAAKRLDAVYFLMNPWPEYSVFFMKPMDTRRCGERSWSLHQADQMQLDLSVALGFLMTDQTRRDKYKLLAGHKDD